MPATNRIPGARTRAKASGEVPKKKNFRLHQSKIDRARELLGTRTETETIEKALDMIAFGTAVTEGIRALYGSGITNVIDEAD